MNPRETFKHPLKNGGSVTLIALKETEDCRGCIFNAPGTCYNADIGYRVKHITGPCSDNKFIFKIYKNDMKEVTLEIPEGKEAKWVNNVLTLVDKEVKYGDIRDHVKGWDDVLLEAKTVAHIGILREDLKHAINLSMSKDTVAYIKLRMIALVLNEGWKPDFGKDEQRWYPWFKIGENGSVSFEYAYYGASDAYAHFGSHLAFKSKELAEYAGTRFTEIYKDYLL